MNGQMPVKLTPVIPSLLEQTPVQPGNLGTLTPSLSRGERGKGVSFPSNVDAWAPIPVAPSASMPVVSAPVPP